MPDRTGQQLGNYQLIRLLGQGGFAEVYLAEHIHLNTEAAIKVLHTKLAKDDVELFRHEARTIARLLHPNIIRVLDFGVSDTLPFLVMDYAPSGTLRQRHPRGSQLPLPIVLTYVKELASALQHAHDLKLIHRDVKPENMLIGRRNEILLGDFGIALIVQSSLSQSTQDIVGTVAYMAPEQIQGKARPASDQYSLAVVVYEWLCGSRPFQGSFAELVTQQMAAPPPPMREKNPTISAALERVVLTALEKDPHKRFENVQAFVATLESCLPEQSQISTSGTLQLTSQSPSSVMMPSATIVQDEIPPTSISTPALSESTPPLVTPAIAGSPTNVVSTNTPALPQSQSLSPTVIELPEAGTASSTNPVPTLLQPTAGVPTNIISTNTPVPESLAGAPTNAISTDPSAPAPSQSTPVVPTSPQRRRWPQIPPSPPTLADCLIPTHSQRTSLLRDSLLTVGFIILFVLFSRLAIDIPPITPFPFTLRTLIVLLIGAVLGSRRGTLATLAAVLIALALSALPGSNTLIPLFPFAHQQPFLEATPAVSGNGINILPYLFLSKYVIAAFVTGLLCERLLDRKISTSILATLPGSLIIFVFSLCFLVLMHQLSLSELSQKWVRIIPIYPISSLLAAALLIASWKILQLMKRSLQ